MEVAGAGRGFWPRLVDGALDCRTRSMRPALTVHSPRNSAVKPTAQMANPYQVGIELAMASNHAQVLGALSHSLLVDAEILFRQPQPPPQPSVSNLVQLSLGPNGIVRACQLQDRGFEPHSLNLKFNDLRGDYLDLLVSNVLQ
jgi:hypothetical protein